MKQWANLSKKTTVARTEGSNLLPAFVTVNTSKRRILIASPHTVWSMSFEVHCHWRPSMWIVPWCSYKCVFLMNLLYYSPFTLGSGTEPLPDGSINSNVYILWGVLSILLYPGIWNIPVKGSFLFRNSGRSLDAENFGFLFSRSLTSWIFALQE